MSNRSTPVPDRYLELSHELYLLIDTAPEEAIRRARSLEPDEVLDQSLTTTLRAAILVDAGAALKDIGAIEEGVTFLRASVERHPNRLDLLFNLANGLVGLADAVPCEGPGWSLSTAGHRREARQLYWDVANQSDDRGLKGCCLTNLANALLRGYRYIEAYDYYMSALTVDPTNAVAHTGAVKVLLRFADIGVGDRETLLAIVAQHLDAAGENIDRLGELAGARAVKELEELLESGVQRGEMPNLSGATDYERFVAESRLALSPTIERLDVSVRRWDSLAFPTVVEPLDGESGVPPIFAMFNMLKSDYLAARHLAFQAITSAVPETGSYSDTLDYAVYGASVSSLMLAQRACYDLLDKVAVAVSHYLGLPGKPSNITFRSRWFENDSSGARTWQQGLADEIRLGVVPLVALSEVSDDVESGGFLFEKRVIRRTATHRFTVLHDLGVSPSRECRYIDHTELRRFQEHVVDTLRLSRAALFYLFEVVLRRESRLSRQGGPKGRLYVPDHDWVRGRTE